MDKGTLIGCIVGGIVVFCAAIFGGLEIFAYFLNIPSLLIVFGGTSSALLIAYPLKSVKNALIAARKCLASTKTNPQAIVNEIVSFAEATRRTGLLAQESRIEQIRDPFLAEGLNLIVDGLPHATVENILSSEIEAMQQRHQQVRNIMVHGGKCAPAFGMIGTIIGLVMMLTNLDPTTIGPGMAIAVLTTLYGLLATNLIFLPIAEKLRQLHDAEVQVKTMIIRGVLAIQAGEHPRIIQLKLLTFLPLGERLNEPQERIVLKEAAIPLPVEEDIVETKQAA